MVTVCGPQGQDMLNEVKFFGFSFQLKTSLNVTLFLRFFFLLFPVPLAIVRQGTSLEEKQAAFALTQACHAIFHHAASL